MKFIKGLLYFILAVVSISCIGEAKEQLKQAKSTVANTSAIIKEAKKVEGRIEKLKETVPLTNEQLKSWLPNKLGEMNRTGFKIGHAGMYQVNSVEGTFKEENGDAFVKVQVIDGAGPTGSMMAAGYGMLGNLEMEEENEEKHKKTVEVDGARAQQTYYKKANRTQLMFAHAERFLVTFTGNEMNPAEAWEAVEGLGLNDLVKMTE
ncbi:hypothetical protein [Cytophaga sp. FL35]|uniref:hypothetical protein n=1 Tax=Cytophaga sp. FL35 TaxID=1904456 RepID=UPI001653A3D0|nr:hypothetical protein [Cytophaga sp. FL35]MBC6997395.1 hypothetical protein [Cytophaga sp. FL35]